MAFGKQMSMMGGKMKPKSAKAPEGESKPEPKGKVAGEDGDGPGDAKSPIHEHLSKMHEMTGNAHTHVEHHMGGGHTSHHISEHGEMSGPHDHASTDDVKGGMDQMLGMGDGMAPMDDQKPAMAPQHAMSGF